jgi:hypothetical protein
MGAEEKGRVAIGECHTALLKSHAALEESHMAIGECRMALMKSHAALKKSHAAIGVIMYSNETWQHIFHYPHEPYHLIFSIMIISRSAKRRRSKNNSVHDVLNVYCKVVLRR